eukprot:GHVQ01035652.1.p1 GENE.GHVQ01035652.1~~GHVQ01035652.1.p1  ORF type:complete len:144 (-),score=12.59 GHVQ01035652.1:727-1158(-)
MSFESPHAQHLLPMCHSGQGVDKIWTMRESLRSMRCMRTRVTCGNHTKTVAIVLSCLLMMAHEARCTRGQQGSQAAGSSRAEQLRRSMSRESVTTNNRDTENFGTRATTMICNIFVFVMWLIISNYEKFGNVGYGYFFYILKP